MTKPRFFLFFCASLLLLAACGDDDVTSVDASEDTTHDTAEDTSDDDASDVGVDAPIDSGTDTNTRETCSEPGATRSASCGMCGMGQEMCTDGFWELSGPCLGQGECSPGALETQSTDMCGELSRLCDNACTWGAFEQTMPDKDCMPGQERNDTNACGDDQYQPQTCSATCDWENTGMCAAYCPNLDTDGLDEEVCVPEGPFIRGASDCASGRSPEACPQAEVQMSTYAIDRYPVTVNRYRSCVEDGACSRPALNDDVMVENVAAWVHKDSAARFCAWVGRSLPTEAMLEKALRGPAPRNAAYPWPGDSYCNGSPRPGCDGVDVYPNAVTAFPDDRGWYPINAIGSLQFWTSDTYAEDFYSDPASLVDPHNDAPGQPLIRLVSPRTSVSERIPANESSTFFFRCARYVQP